MTEPHTLTQVKSATIDGSWTHVSIAFIDAKGAEQTIRIPTERICDLSGFVQRACEMYAQQKEQLGQRGNWRELWTRSPAKIDVQPLPMQAAVAIAFDLDTPFQIVYRLTPDQAQQLAALLVQRSNQCAPPKPQA